MESEQMYLIDSLMKMGLLRGGKNCLPLLLYFFLLKNTMMGLAINIVE